MEITLNGRGERNKVWGKCCFVITALGSRTFKNINKPRKDIPHGDNGQGRRPSGDWDGGAFVPAGTVLIP